MNTIQTYQSNSTGPFTMEYIKGKPGKVHVYFLTTGHVMEAHSSNALAGKVKDPYYPTRYGVGFHGEGYKVYPWWKQAMQLWSNMLKRCYCESDPKGYAKRGVVVDSRWHNFKLFCDDIRTLPGFDRWLRNENMQLDKDRIGDGSTYSKAVCIFLSEFENKSQVPNYRIGKVFDKTIRKWVSVPL